MTLLKRHKEAPTLAQGLHPLTTRLMQSHLRTHVTADLAIGRLPSLLSDVQAWPVCVEYSRDRGIFLVASRDIARGEVVLEEFPCVAALRDAFVDSHCGGCFRLFNQDRLAKVKPRVDKLVPRSFLCRLCEGGVLNACDEMTNYTILQPTDDYYIDGLWTRFFQRALLLGGMSPFDKQDATVALPAACSSWLLPGKVESDLDNLTDKEIAEITNFLMDLFGSSDLDASLVQSLMQNLAYNCHAIADSSMTTIGIANFPMASFLNHACDPNLFWTAECPSILSDDVAPKWIGTASRDIKAGTELTISYGPVVAQPHSQRQKRLLEGFFFRCFCASCEGVCWSCQKRVSGLKRCQKCRMWDACKSCINKGHACAKWDKLEKLCHSHA